VNFPLIIKVELAIVDNENVPHGMLIHFNLSNDRDMRN
jgi:hypothetical protein